MRCRLSYDYNEEVYIRSASSLNLKNSRFSMPFFRRKHYQQLPRSEVNQTPSPPSYGSAFDADQSTEPKVYRRSSRSSSVSSTCKGGLVRKSSVASSTASSMSNTPIEHVWAKARPEPLPVTDPGSGTRSYTHNKPIPILNITWVEWEYTSPPREYKPRSSGHQTAPCCLCVNPILRGQPLSKRIPGATREVFRAVPIYLVENTAPDFVRTVRKRPAYTSWVAYFDKTYPGWDWSKPDWRGDEYIKEQRKRLYSSLEMYDFRYCKWQTKVSISGYKLRIKQ